MKRIHVFDVAPTPTPGGMVGDRPLEEPTVSGSWRVASLPQLPRTALFTLIPLPVANNRINTLDALPVFGLVRLCSGRPRTSMEYFKSRFRLFTMPDVQHPRTFLIPQDQSYPRPLTLHLFPSQRAYRTPNVSSAELSFIRSQRQRRRPSPGANRPEFIVVGHARVKWRTGHHLRGRRLPRRLRLNLFTLSPASCRRQQTRRFFSRAT